MPPRHGPCFVAGVVTSPANPIAAWEPTLGAVPASRGARFSVWAPESTRVDVVFERENFTLSRPLARLARWRVHGLGTGSHGGHALSIQPRWPCWIARPGFPMAARWCARRVCICRPE